MADIKYEIEKTLCTFPADNDGWTLEVNLVSWAGREAKYDIRKWNADHSRSTKGITLSEDELILLFNHADDVLNCFRPESSGKGTSKKTKKKTDDSELKMPFE